MSEIDTSKIGKRLGNISDLPDELRKQLHAAKTDLLEDQIIEVLNELEGYGNLDEVLVGLYKKYSTVHDRTFISNKMYRMASSGLLSKVSGKKAAYRVK